MGRGPPLLTVGKLDTKGASVPANPWGGLPRGVDFEKVWKIFFFGDTESGSEGIFGRIRVRTVVCARFEKKILDIEKYF